MPEETIYCPSCNNKVRVPEELLGQPVQCPLCKLVFTAPVRGPAAAPGEPPVVLPAPPAASTPGVPAPIAEEEDNARLAVMMRVRPAAMALLLVGVLGWTFSAWTLYITKMNGVPGVERQMEDTKQFFRNVLPDDLFEQLKEELDNTSPESRYQSNLIFGLIFTVLSAGVIIGAIQMMRLRMYWVAVVGSFLAMANLMCGCCVLGLPVGGWSLSVLLRPEVRRAFE